jgi:hypothetical protein
MTKFRDQKLHNLEQALRSAEAKGNTKRLMQVKGRIVQRQRLLSERLEQANRGLYASNCGLPLW